MDDAVAVRACIAQAVLGATEQHDGRPTPDVAEPLGAIVLHPHQRDAVRRILRALDRHGGALLADAPGLGKTYTALAVARHLGGALVIAPAALRTQWQRSAQRAGVSIEWTSVERLSRLAPIVDCNPRRTEPSLRDTRLLIIDEAHHLRNPRTRRYARAASLAIGRRVLLLSATPVHNRAGDRDALLALFLGASSGTLNETALADMMIRRDATALAVPRVAPVRWLAAPSTCGLAAALRALPPPLPAADGRAAGALLRMVLAHAWSSSVAALDRTLRHLLLRAAAIDDALRTGRWPTRRELRDWLAVGDGTQLSFVELTAAPARTPLEDARRTLETFRDAVLALRRRINEARGRDAAARVECLRSLMRRHAGATIVAFSRYAATVDALWRALRADAGIVALTARGVRAAGSGLRRAEVLAALAGIRPNDPRLPLRLVLSTDLLGEGHDLLAASVIVHLDQAWTPARMTQREGRAARLGSPHTKVAVYALRPPRDAARMLAIAATLRHKRHAMRDSTAPAELRECLVSLALPWAQASEDGTDAPRPPVLPLVAAVRATCGGWLAVMQSLDGHRRVIAGSGRTAGDEDTRVLQMLQAIPAWRSIAAPDSAVRAARSALRRWHRRSAAADLSEGISVDSRARAIVRQRIDEALRSTPLHLRRERQQQLKEVVRVLASARGAGAERVIAQAAREPTLDALCGRLRSLHLPAPQSQGPAPPQWRMLALLVLVADRGGADAVSARPHEGKTSRDRAPRSAAWSGTAAPR